MGSAGGTGGASGKCLPGHGVCMLRFTRGVCRDVPSTEGGAVDVCQSWAFSFGADVVRGVVRCCCEYANGGEQRKSVEDRPVERPSAQGEGAGIDAIMAQEILQAAGKRYASETF